MGRKQISHTLDQRMVDRVDALKMGAESRSSVLRRVADVGVPILEKQKMELKRLER